MEATLHGILDGPAIDACRWWSTGDWPGHDAWPGWTSQALVLGPQALD
jgi:hypothetical protein